MSVEILTAEAASSGLGAARPIWPAIKRGLACRCPACGEGRIFTSYLKVAPACDHCGLDLSHHRADDMPPYLTILIVGHVVVPLVMYVETTWQPAIWLQLAVWLPLTLILSLLLLPPIKGAVIGYQWATRMHGFDPASAGDVVDPTWRPLPDADRG